MMRTSHTLFAVLVSLTGLASSAFAVRPVTITGQTPGATPFISFVTLHLENPNAFDYAEFSVQPKPGSATRPVSARYSRAYLLRRVYLHADQREIVVAIFVLYANLANTVSLTTGFVDGNSQQDTVLIQTADYQDAYRKHPEVVQARLADTTLSYDFMLLKSFGSTNSPIIVDTDGELRWAGTADVQSIPSAVYQNGIYVAGGAGVLRMEFDGTVTALQDYGPIGVTAFPHNFDFGRDGLLASVSTATETDAVVIEFDVNGNILRQWDMAKIISAAMTAGGDDPTKFVAPGSDWFHNNASAYRASDNSIVISSRENFLICLDYDTQAIKWIFGDPTKNWYQFPSLRKYALTYAPGTHPPIGQHAVSFFNDRLLLFDNGYHSLFETPAGRNLPYSAPRKYRVDTTAGSATEVWSDVDDKAFYSPVCSSIYEDQPNNYLIDYASGGPFTNTVITGLDAQNQRVFEYNYGGESTCASGWNAVVVHLEKMSFN